MIALDEKAASAPPWCNEVMVGASMALEGIGLSVPDRVHHDDLLKVVGYAWQSCPQASAWTNGGQRSW